MFRRISCVITVFIIDYIQGSDAACTTNSGGVYTFGPNCEYMCHCKSSGACDSSTGYCSNGCDTEWFGPGCQFRDLAEKEISRQLDNMKVHQLATRANDGNVETCSYTDNATVSRTISPWWRVQFPQNETIQNMIIVTKDEYLHYFKGFKVTVEKAPADQVKVIEYYPPASDVQMCYQHSNYAPTNKTIHVTCNTPLEGNLVRIQLARTDTQLVLCDVRINGGRNMAFGKGLTFSSAYNENLYPPTNAVDGILTNANWDYCFAIYDNSEQTADWFIVNLGHLSFIQSIKITTLVYNYQRIKYYKLYISNTTEGVGAVEIHDDTRNYPTNLEIAVGAVGQFVNLSRSSWSPTVVCEMEIYGDCIAGKCGYDCSKNCQCKTIEDKISGVCNSGCEGRWTGPGLECINKCGEFQWGETCSNQCGQCNNSHSCDVVTGYCPFGCQDGYIDTPLCDIECADGTYGENCTHDCSGKCNGGDVCRTSDGYCERGCSPGYTGNKCEEECTSGWYGINCTLMCSTNCEGGSPNCHHVNGTCLLGCNSGFEGHMCDKECDNGFWYKNCEKRCGSCLYGTCNKTDGVCDGGCSAGYKTTQKCIDECDDLTFGINCGSTCDTNCVDVCDKASGTCSNCKSGWKGDSCNQSCENNEWGENCQSICGKCLSGSCDRFNGRCTGGCLPGYKTTSMCTEECPDGTYGAGCVSNCTANCKVHGRCNNVNGRCEGCIAGKRGDQCDLDCDVRTYGEDCLQSCGACDNNETCDSKTGSCRLGCDKGFKHSLLCQEECDDGSHGANCTGVCGICKPGTVCEKVTGVCHEGCSERFTGSLCVEETETPSLVPVIAGVGAAIIVVIILGVLVNLWYLRRTRNSSNVVKQENRAYRGMAMSIIGSEASDVNQADMCGDTYDTLQGGIADEHQYELIT